MVRWPAVEQGRKRAHHAWTHPADENISDGGLKLQEAAIRKEQEQNEEALTTLKCFRWI